MLASVVLGASVVARADDTRPVYAASHVLEPGQALTTADLHVVDVQLGGQSGHYLDGRHRVAPGAVMLRSVQAGELVPTSAIGDQAAVRSRPVSIPVSAGAVDGLRPGALVDVWVSAKGADAQTFDPPRSVVSGAEVVSVRASGGVLSAGSDTTVRLLLANELVPQVLSAVDNGARIDVVPVPGSVPRGGS